MTILPMSRAASANRTPTPPPVPPPKPATTSTTRTSSIRARARSSSSSIHAPARSMSPPLPIPPSDAPIRIFLSKGQAASDASSVSTAAYFNSGTRPGRWEIRRIPAFPTATNRIGKSSRTGSVHSV